MPLRQGESQRAAAGQNLTTGQGATLARKHRPDAGTAGEKTFCRNHPMERWQNGLHCRIYAFLDAPDLDSAQAIGTSNTALYLSIAILDRLNPGNHILESQHCFHAFTTHTIQSTNLSTRIRRKKNFPLLVAESTTRPETPPHVSTAFIPTSKISSPKAGFPRLKKGSIREK